MYVLNKVVVKSIINHLTHVHTLARKHTSCISDKHTCTHANIRTHVQLLLQIERVNILTTNSHTQTCTHTRKRKRAHLRPSSRTHTRTPTPTSRAHTLAHASAHIHTHKYTTTVTVFSARDCCICGGAQLLLQIQCGEINQTATQVRECDIGSDLCVRWKKSEPQLKICTFSWKKQQHNSCCTPNKWWCSVWEKEKLIKLPLRARSFVCVRRKKS